MVLSVHFYPTIWLEFSLPLTAIGQKELGAAVFRQSVLNDTAIDWTLGNMNLFETSMNPVTLTCGIVVVYKMLY